MFRLIQGYQYCLKRFTLTTQAVQTGVLMGFGDIIAQVAIEKTHIRDISTRRTTEFFLLGTFAVGPALATCYNVLDKLPGRVGVVRAMKKAFIDQFIFTPCLVGALLVLINIIQGHSVEEIKKNVSHDYFDVMIVTYMVWPWVMFLNFYITPLKYQILIAQTVALFYNTYLSWKSHVMQKNVTLLANQNSK